jgi:glycogen(starch) synthase
VTDAHGLNILMTADAVGGVWQYALQLARALRLHGAQVALATMGPALSPDQRLEAAEVGNVTLFESAFKLEWMPDPWDDVARAGDWLLNVEADFGPDVIHLNGYVHASLPWRAPVIVVGHSCALSRWRAVKGEEAPASWERYRMAVTLGLQSADFVVAPSGPMLKALQRHYGPLPRSRVIHSGRDPADFHGGDKQPVILTAGRLWDEAKNIALLAAVAPELPWPVRVAGDGRCPKTVTALGRLSGEAMAREMSLASIYALPARYEPFGLSILEAALSGCALVLGDVDSLREVWGDAAVFVAPYDACALHGALMSLIDEESMRRTLAQRGAARAAERYTSSRMADAYAATYAELVRSRPRERAHPVVH